jgi:deoxyribonuclease IV
MATIGAHVGMDDPLTIGREVGAGCVQVFLSDPQAWKVTVDPAYEAALAAATVPVYVHAPYGINVASANNRVRIPSRKLLADTCAAAARVGAAAVIVHGGHVTANDSVEEGFARWRKALERLDSPVQLLLENTAGGNHAMARHVDTLARLWDHVGDLGLGFCLDTCHAHAAGEDLTTVVDRIRSITGRIDLVHCNDSRDPASSGRDRHTNFSAADGDGQIGADTLVAVCAAAGTTVICETPLTGIADDIRLLHERVNPGG